MIQTYEDMQELMDRIQLAHRYNEKTITFKKQKLSVAAAERLADDYSKGGKRGDKQ